MRTTMMMKKKTRSMCLHQKKKERRGRKKKETNNPPPPPIGGGVVGGGTYINVAQVGVTTETIGGTSNGGTRVVNERVHPMWFTLVVCDKQ
ncbi:hypothetical protein KY289_000888 [Solanum tuberosum]|nr:hypothetical protein KY289_000888 [Solanum tuberosum]